MSEANPSEPKLIDLAGALARIDAARQIVITTHARADGDAIGSVAAMQRVLRQREKAAQGFLHEPVPERYGFMSQLEPLAVWGDHPAAILAKADLLLVLDTCSTVQLDAIAPAVRDAKLLKLAIDHHITRDPIVDEVLVDETAAACSQMLAMLFDSAEWLIDEASATLLYTGLATDTGWFRFSNADARSYATAAWLAAAGATPNELYERLYLNETLARARLIGAVMSGFELLADGRLAVIKLTRETLARCGATQQMTEDLINEPQRVGSVMVCLLFVEPADNGPIRISLRSKRDVDVAAIAAQFGGGGHARAAGAKLAGRWMTCLGGWSRR